MLKKILNKKKTALKVLKYIYMLINFQDFIIIVEIENHLIEKLYFLIWPEVEKYRI